MQKSNLHVTFLLNVCTSCCLLLNLLKFEDETNIAKLLRIIELEVNSQDEQQHKQQGVVDEVMNQMQVQGQKISKEAI